VEQLVLPDKFITLRLHILHFIMVLREGAIELGLEHGGVFLGLGEFFLQSLGRSTVSPNPWSISDFCRDISTTSSRRKQLLE
jgi:hypothetical protein